MKFTRFFIFILLVMVASVFTYAPLLAKNDVGKVKTIVIDPGHGGRDPGAVFGKIYEKDIVLKVAISLGEKIKAKYPDMKIVYTRKTDVYITLDNRGKIANDAQADLFLSIHVDATSGSSANGTSSWVMGMEKSAQNLRQAMRENDVVVYEEDYTTKYEGYIPGSTESYIIFTLMQYANTDQSMKFASILQKNYNKHTPLNDRGARQGPFFVLWRTTMPSVLTELGFITNTKDRSFLLTQKGQDIMVGSLLSSITEYKNMVEGSGVQVPVAEVVEVTTNDEGIIFAVQLCSSSKRMKKSDSRFKSYKNKVTEVKAGRIYKYYVGDCGSYNEARRLQSSVRREFSDAFMIAFHKNKQISVSKAREILK